MPNATPHTRNVIIDNPEKSCCSPAYNNEEEFAQMNEKIDHLLKQ